MLVKVGKKGGLEIQMVQLEPYFALICDELN